MYPALGRFLLLLLLLFFFSARALTEAKKEGAISTL